LRRQTIAGEFSPVPKRENRLKIISVEIAMPGPFMTETAKESKSLQCLCELYIAGLTWRFVDGCTNLVNRSTAVLGRPGLADPPAARHGEPRKNVEGDTGINKKDPLFLVQRANVSSNLSRRGHDRTTY
jgi:hypothetical protein